MEKQNKIVTSFHTLFVRETISKNKKIYLYSLFIHNQTKDTTKENKKWCFHHERGVSFLVLKKHNFKN